MPLYHIWFSTKRRKRFLEGDVLDLTEQALRDIATEDGIDLLECKGVFDHVHLLLRCSSDDCLPGVMKALKGKSAYRIFRAAPDLRLVAQTGHLWQRGYGWKHVDPAAEGTVRRYIRSQMDRLEKFDS